MIPLELKESEIEDIIGALQLKQGDLAKTYTHRQTNKQWAWETFKDSVINGFEKQEDFEQWKNGLQQNTKAQIKYFENLQAKLEQALFKE